MKRTVAEGEIHGADELAEHLKNLGDKFERRVMRAASIVGMKYFRAVLLQKARRLDMSATGRRRLRQAIQISKPRYRKRWGRMMTGIHIASLPRTKPGRGGKAKAVNDPQIWWRWFEYGTGKRYRSVGRGKAAAVARAVTGSQRGYSGFIEAQPFLEPTFLEEADGALHAIIADARKRTERALKRKGKA